MFEGLQSLRDFTCIINMVKGYVLNIFLKSHIRETLNLLTHAHSSTDTKTDRNGITNFEGGAQFFSSIFFLWLESKI